MKSCEKVTQRQEIENITQHPEHGQPVPEARPCPVPFLHRYKRQRGTRATRALRNGRVPPILHNNTHKQRTTRPARVLGHGRGHL